MNTTLQVRIDQKDKKQAQKIFKKMGMDLSSGVNMFIKQVITDKAVPFRPRTANGYTPEFEAELLRRSREMKSGGGKTFKTVADLMKYLEK